MNNKSGSEGGGMYSRNSMRCPSCGAHSLFVDSGGGLTCGVIGCKEPCLTYDSYERFQHLQKLCDEQKGEIETLLKSMGVWELVKDLKSQLATQTERVRVLEEALEKIADYPDEIASCAVAKQALNQESLGDGK